MRTIVIDSMPHVPWGINDKGDQIYIYVWKSVGWQPLIHKKIKDLTRYNEFRKFLREEFCLFGKSYFIYGFHDCNNKYKYKPGFLLEGAKNHLIKMCSKEPGSKKLSIHHNMVDYSKISLGPHSYGEY